MKDSTTIRNVIAGLSILAAHGATDCSPGHDILYCGPSNNPSLSDADILALLDAGWAPGDGNVGCGCDETQRDDDLDWEDSPVEVRLAAVREHACADWYRFM